jgi:hypothetical protein
METSKEPILFRIVAPQGAVEDIEKNLYWRLLCGESVPKQIVPFRCVAIWGLKKPFTEPSNFTP